MKVDLIIYKLVQPRNKRDIKDLMFSDHFFHQKVRL